MVAHYLVSIFLVFLTIINGCLFVLNRPRTLQIESAAGVKSDSCPTYHSTQLIEPLGSVPPLAQEVSIPFYLYDEQVYRDLEANCSRDPEYIDFNQADIYFIDQLKSHRWRVKNPQDALLFVVPIPWGRIFDKKCDKMPANLDAVIQAIESSSWFKRFEGKDHITITSQWMMANWLARDNKVVPSLSGVSNGKLRNIIKNMITTSHFLTPTSSCRFVVPYPRDMMDYLPSNSRDTKRLLAKERSYSSSIRRLQGSELREVDLIERAKSYLGKRKYTFGFAGKYKRGGYELRRNALKNLPGFLSPNVLVGTDIVPKNETTCTDDFIEGCYMNWQRNNPLFKKVLTESKFCLFFRGDDWSSARLYDYIASGCVMIAVSDGLLDLGLPLQCDIDWKKVLIKITEDEFSGDPRGALAKYMPDTNTTAGLIDIGKRIAEIERIRPIVIFNEPKSLTSELILVDAFRKCLPENRINEYRNQHRDSSDVIVKSSPASLTDLRCMYPDYSKRFADPRYIGKFFQNPFQYY